MTTAEAVSADIVNSVRADVPFEAAFLRGALLVGLLHERDAHDWAEALIQAEPDLQEVLADILMTPVELSAMREALWPLAKDVDPRRVGMALLAGMARDRTERPADARVRMLGQIRESFPMPKEIGAAIKSFENRRMFAAAGVETVKSPATEELAAFLDRFGHADAGDPAPPISRVAPGRER
jgi:hypothetical protein